MKIKTIFLALAAGTVLILGFFFLSPSSPSSPSPSLFEPKKSDAGNVTVIVTPKNLTSGKPASFDVVFDTHSVNLDFDVATLATLTDDQGTSCDTPAWSGDPPAGHHRRGTLSFPTVLSPSTQHITLTFTNIAGVPARRLEWNIK